MLFTNEITEIGTKLGKVKNRKHKEIFCGLWKLFKHILWLINMVEIFIGLCEKSPLPHPFPRPTYLMFNVESLRLKYIKQKSPTCIEGETLVFVV